jgi:hypothetical protein
MKTAGGAGTVRALDVFFAQWIVCPNRAVGWAAAARRPCVYIRKSAILFARQPRLTA